MFLKAYNHDDYIFIINNYILQWLYWKIFLVEILDKLIVTLPALQVRLWLLIYSKIKCNGHELELYNRLGFSLGLIGSWYF